MWLPGWCCLVQVLVAVLETSRIVALALYPVTPGLAARMHQQLGLAPLTPEVRHQLMSHPPAVQQAWQYADDTAC